MSLIRLSDKFEEVSRICTSLPRFGIELTQKFQTKFSEYIERTPANGGYTSVVFDRGVVVFYSKNKQSFIPSVGFVIAKTLVGYLQLLLQYKTIAFNALGSDYTNGDTGKSNIEKLKKGTFNANDLYNRLSVSLDSDAVQKVTEFLTNYDSWGGGKTIDRGDFFVSPLMKCAGLQAESQSAIAEITEVFLKNPTLIEALDYTTVELDKKGEDMAEPTDIVPFPHNRIFFGAPGTGKSHKLNEEAEQNFAPEYVERVTFYPNYSYSQFVGTYKPVMQLNKTSNQEEIVYSYTPGPFIRQWIKAKQNPSQPVLLIVEELNRANAPAVFGDMFQLLDRNATGASEYSVATSEDLRHYLNSLLPSANATDDAPDSGVCLPEGTDTSKISLPSNFYIWTTMNSADQGVFPLDTAFKRRWKYTYLGINTNEGVIGKYSFLLPSGIYNWNGLRKAINQLLINQRINEDKLLGPFFLNPENLTDAEFVSEFKDKVIMYLFEDAARQYRKNIFSDNYPTYSALCEAFDAKGPLEIFKNLDVAPIRSEMQVEDITSNLDGFEDYLNGLDSVSERTASIYVNSVKRRLLSMAENGYVIQDLENPEKLEEIKQMINSQIENDNTRNQVNCAFQKFLEFKDITQ